MSHDGRARLADRPGSLAVEGVSGFPEGLPRSRGGSERRPRSGAVASGLESRSWRCLVTKGHLEKREFASAAAARKLTRATPTGAASASRRWPGASAPARRHFRAPYPERRLGSKWPLCGRFRCSPGVSGFSCVVAEVSRRCQAQTRFAGCGWRTPRGPSPRPGARGDTASRSRSGWRHPGRPHGSRRAAGWRKASGARTVRRLSRGGGQIGIGWLVGPASSRVRWLATRASEVGWSGTSRM